MEWREVVVDLSMELQLGLVCAGEECLFSLDLLLGFELSIGLSP